MTQPASSFETLRPDLRDSLMEFDLQADQLGFVGLKIAPVLEVNKPLGYYGVIPLKEMLQDRDTRRASDGSYNRISGEGDNASFLTEEHGIEEPVDRREANAYGDYWDAEQLAAERTRDAVIRNHNKRVIALAEAVSTTTAAGTAWTDLSSSDPPANVLTARKAVRDRCGMLANCMVIDWDRFESLRQTTAIKDLIKYSGRDDPKARNITVDAVAAAMNLEEIIISGSMKNTANQAVAASLSSMWDKTKALIFRRYTGRDLKKPQFARTFHWGGDGSMIGGVFEEYYDPKVRADVVRNRMDTKEQVIYADCAQLITGI